MTADYYCNFVDATSILYVSLPEATFQITTSNHMLSAYGMASFVIGATAT